MSTPVPNTGRPHHHKRYPKNGGLSGRILGRWPDEGDKGPEFRRIIRSRERAMWRKEARNDA